MKSKKMTCEIARNICIVQALAKSGYFPKRESEKEAWFLSPFRSETQASFKVNKMINRWYDHGEGTGGSLIDLVCLIYNCTVKEALEILNKDLPSFSFQQQPFIKVSLTKKIRVKYFHEIYHEGLLTYLRNRKISFKETRKYCKEIHYSFNNKHFFSIGLQNQSGGWELRNKYYKNSSSPKDISLIKNGNPNLVVTEGMFDMLSILTHIPNLDHEFDILVLNSVAFTDKAIEISKDYKIIHLYLDNDKAGKYSTEKFIQSVPNSKDRSYLYKNHKDINDWFMSKK